ncbi:MAG TPA: hypothetical protein VE135_25750 [Pyrinomonadaceae bacterium]|nr:hypothetical protein [Pyrinomonadaceae bacterium]
MESHIALLRFFWRVNKSIHEVTRTEKQLTRKHCGTVEEANAYMHSDAFAANATGVEIDPKSLLAQYRSGSAATILR